MNSQRWAYESVTLKPNFWSGTSTIELQKILNEMGQRGWELIVLPANLSVTTSGTVLFFKRPI
jgi:Domain of unknown function (DUF4177)